MPEKSSIKKGCQGGGCAGTFGHVPVQQSP